MGSKTDYFIFVQDMDHILLVSSVKNMIDSSNVMGRTARVHIESLTLDTCSGEVPHFKGVQNNPNAPEF